MPFSGAGLGRSIVTSSSGLLRSIIISDKGSVARKRMLFAVVRDRIDEGGVYCTSERENSGGKPVLATLDDGTKPVSSLH